MGGRPYILSETTWSAVRETRFEIAILPWGATEAHNLHLPYGTDTIQCDTIAAESARIAWEQGARAVVLPTIPFGVNTGQLDIPLCVNVMPSTQALVLRDIARTLAPHGVRKLVILNGHGANDFKQMIRELQPDVKLFLSTVDWYKVVEARGFFDELGDHAGELETSVMQSIAPELVLPLSQAGAGAQRPSRLTAIREGWAWSPRQWTRVTDDTGIGDPRAATVDKGARYIRAVTEKIASFLVELAALDPRDPYLPHE